MVMTVTMVVDAVGLDHFQTKTEWLGPISTNAERQSHGAKKRYIHLLHIIFSCGNFNHTHIKIHLVVYVHGYCSLAHFLASLHNSNRVLLCLGAKQMKSGNFQKRIIINELCWSEKTINGAGGGEAGDEQKNNKYYTCKKTTSKFIWLISDRWSCKSLPLFILQRHQCQITHTLT